MQDLFVTSFEIAAEDHEAAFEAIAREIGAWAWRGEGHSPDIVGKPQGNQEDGQRRVSWSLLALPDIPERAFEFELRHPDQREQGIEWRTVVELCRGADYLRFSLRISREATEFRLAPAALELRRPGLIPLLLDRFQCSSGGVHLTTSADVLHVDSVEGFVSAILHSPERTLPVVVVSTASGATEPEVDVDELADELAGLAHVVTLGGYLAWERFRDMTGAFEFVPPGGARIYWPGFGDRRDRLRHPYWTRRRLREAHPSFQSQAFRKLSRLSVGRIPRDPLVRNLQRAVRERRLVEAKEAHNDRELLDAYEEMLTERDQEVQHLETEVNGLRAENEHLRDDLERQARQWAAVRGAVEADEADERPEVTVESWEEFTELAPALETKAFVLTDRAREHCGDNPYPHPGRMWAHLESLAQAAERYRELDASVGSRLKEWIAENFSLEIALFDGGLGESRFEYAGETYSREPHVKVDDFKDPSECGRIYFAVDSTGKRFIVDHIGLHL